MKIKNGSREEKNGWTFLSIKGSAQERGYAHGYLMAPELKEIFKMLEFFLLNTYGHTCQFFSEVMSELFTPQIQKNFPELYAEMEAIAKGANAKGCKLTTSDIIMWNCYTSIDSMIAYLPELIQNNPLLNKKYGELFQIGSRIIEHGHAEGGARLRGGQSDHCTTFMAVGNYTKDGKIVCAHNSFVSFIDGQYSNVILCISPAETNANRIIMQSSAGWIWSGSDYYVTSNGFICTESTIGGFFKFVLKDPICCRIRQAMQYAKTLDECATYLTTNNSGDYANSWLIGDTKTNTIMRVELGLQYVNIEKKTNGYFIGYNAAEDPRIRNLECVNSGYEDIRRHQGARRVRLTQFMEEYKGQLDLAAAQEILADHYDVYLNKINPCSRTCCSHYELDDRAFMSQADRPKPYQLRGAVDGIVCDTTLAKKMMLLGRWGSSCGTPFEKTPFFQQHLQWIEQEPYIKDRLHQAWTEFSLWKKVKAIKNKTRLREEKIKQLKAKKGKKNRTQKTT